MEDHLADIVTSNEGGSGLRVYQNKNIVETDCTPNVTLPSYNYDESGTPPPGTVNDNGQVLNVTDNLSGTEDVFTYDETAFDSGVGQVLSTQEESGLGPSYKVTYSYTPDGDRGTTTYATSNGTTQWQYDSYCSVGMPQNGGACSRVPQTMRLLDSSGDPTPEEFHYIYDGGGRMMAASFAMTPNSSYTPPSGQPWYTPTELASSRCHVVYDNDSGGQLLNLGYYWDTWNSGYSSADLFGSQWTYSYTYDPNTWLKTGATLADFNPHSEAYSYDPMLDYLTQATNAGNDGQTENWAYDPAGNRHDSGSGFSNWTFDNLNRLTASPGLTYSNDILGNRLSNSATSNGWDQLNRMTSFTSGTVTTNYSYRADGMRVQKSDSNGNSTSFAYDGQMGFEDNEPQGNNVGVTDYAIGPRGIDRIAFTSGSNTAVSYPIYDGHGNMACTLTASGGNCNASNNERQYDGWGGVAYGQGSLGPKGRYCANLGHKQDDESGLVYMRARYEDASTGRFVSQDPKMQGNNWFSYCGNEPIDRTDVNGKFWWFFAAMALVGALAGIFAYIMEAEAAGGSITIGGVAGAGVSGALIGLVAAIFAPEACAVSAAAAGEVIVYAIASGQLGGALAGLGGIIHRSADEFFASPAGKAVADCMGEQLLIEMELDEDNAS